MNVVSIALMLLGLGFMLVGGIGAIRLPDFYTRSHAIGVMDTLGGFLVLSGMILFYGFGLTSLKLAFVLILVYLANPTITHILVRAAMKSGLEPWTRKRR